MISTARTVMFASLLVISSGAAFGADPAPAEPAVPAARLSLVGIGSLDWAAHHPTQGWRILLPVKGDDGSPISADIKEACIATATNAVRRRSCL